MRSCRHVLCVCAVLADVRLANVKKPLIPSTSGWLVAGKKAEKSKKRPIDFLYGLSSLRIRCIQRPNARILLQKWPESGRQHRIYVSEWNENSNVIATKTTTEQPKQQQPQKKRWTQTLKQMTILYEYGNAPQERTKNTKIVFQVVFVVLLRPNDILEIRLLLYCSQQSENVEKIHSRKNQLKRFKPRAVFGFEFFVLC